MKHINKRLLSHSLSSSSIVNLVLACLLICAGHVIGGSNEISAMLIAGRRNKRCKNTMPSKKDWWH